MSRALTLAKPLARRFLWQAQRGRCALCGQQLSRRFTSTALTFDHVWSRSLLKCNDKETGNTVLAHRPCNERKANRRPTGCEIIMLNAVNRYLGYAERETSRFDRVMPRPSPPLH